MKAILAILIMSTPLISTAQDETADSIAAAHAKGSMKGIIRNEEINPYLYKDGKAIVKNPDWSQLYKNIARKYGKEYAKDLLGPEKLHFYGSIREWRPFSVEFDRQIKKRPPVLGGHLLGGVIDDVWELNQQAWNIFLYCKDKKALKRALKWSNLSISLCKNKGEMIQFLDTKSNLLYKLGRVKEAIPLEENVFQLSKDNMDYNLTVVKMKKGIPTWPAK